MRRPAPLPAVRTPQRLIAWAGTPQYAELMAGVLRGRTRIAQVRYFPGNRKAAMFVPAKANDGGRITVGAEFFAGALKDYENWRVKWWREALQNAVDAGAKHVECGIVEQADGTVRVWCQDDGRGMSRDVLLNKFLVLGASGKRDDAGATGGFGKAKEMLLLPWLSWSVTTRDSRIDGAGIDYEVRDVAPAAVGTRLEVVMPADNATSADHALEFIARCHIRGVAFRVVRQNRWTKGEVVVTEAKAALRPGKLALELEGKATIHYDKNGDNGFYIRTGGLFMYDTWLPDGVRGTVIVELTGKSTELLTANRDSIRDAGLRTALQRFTSELSADVKSALAKRGLGRRVYRGTGRFVAEARETEAALTAAASGALAKARPLPAAGGFQLSGETLVELVEMLRGMGEAGVGEGTVDVGGAAPAVAAAMLSSLPVKGPDHLEAAVKLLAWRPDFLVLNDREGWKPPRSLLPEGMSKRALSLAKLWTEVTRYVLIRLGARMEYGVGWCFGDYGAMYVHEQGQHWLLLNPLGGDVAAKPDELPDPMSDAVLRYVYAAAIHEATHMADGLAYHEERFASAFTRNVAICADGWESVVRIREAVLRGAEIDLRRAVVDPTAPAARTAAPGRRGKAPEARERVVERTVYVDRPVETTVYVDRVLPPPPPAPWFAQSIPSAGAPAQLALVPRQPRPAREQQQQLGLSFARRR